MAAQLADLKRWFETAEEVKATHMIVVCDTYDWEDYPVYVNPGEDPRKIAEQYSGKNMQKVMECYKISLGWESQSKEFRANHWD